MNYVTQNGNVVNNMGIKNMELKNIADNLKEVKKTNLLSEETYTYIVSIALSNFLNNKITQKTDHYSKVFNNSIKNTFHHIG